MVVLVGSSFVVEVFVEFVVSVDVVVVVVEPVVGVAEVVSMIPLLCDACAVEWFVEVADVDALVGVMVAVFLGVMVAVGVVVDVDTSSRVLVVGVVGV